MCHCGHLLMPDESAAMYKQKQTFVLLGLPKRLIAIPIYFFSNVCLRWSKAITQKEATWTAGYIML